MPNCPEYTVQIKTYDLRQPTAYKCMNQVEYESYRAEVFQKDHQYDGLLTAFLFGLLIISAVVITVVLRKAFK